jgi:predicted aconitase
VTAPVSLALTDRERRIRTGEAGEAAAWALEQQIAVGEFFGARRLVPVTSVHLMGDTEVMAEAGVAVVERLLEQGGRFLVLVTTNARCVDFERAALVRQRPELVAGEAPLVSPLGALGAMVVDTCVNYQILYEPQRGEHLAWGDTGTVIWANSVAAARTNYEAGPAALAAGLTRVTPAYGYHLDEQRAGHTRFDVRCEPEDLADWGALGRIVGRATLDYWTVPVLAGLRHPPSPDALKHFGAALASYGSCAMYHVVGVTPEARTKPSPSVVGRRGRPRSSTRRPCGGSTPATPETAAPWTSWCSRAAALALRAAPGRRAPGRAPHPLEHGAPGTTSFATRELAARLGYVKAIEDAGGWVLAGVCWYLMEPARMAAAFGWRRVVSNSPRSRTSSAAPASSRSSSGRPSAWTPPSPDGCRDPGPGNRPHGRPPTLPYPHPVGFGSCAGPCWRGFPASITTPLPW